MVTTIPYGTADLVESVRCHSGPPRRVQCYVRGCQNYLLVPSRGNRGDVCPIHGIRCHFSTSGATYSYADAARNIIASPEIFRRKIIGHPFKYESHRLGLERSEDAVSWNVFRSLEDADLLCDLAGMITGERIDVRPFLYLWGICSTYDDFRPWSLLVDARRCFESSLPVERPLTEPDIALHLPGKYLILIEAKFTSSNTSYCRGPRADGSSLTLDELLQIYQAPELTTLNVPLAHRQDRVHYQLWRNMIFAEWMAQQDHPRTQPYHVNLVRHGYDEDSAREFSGLIHVPHKHRFLRLTWEKIHRRFRDNRKVSRLVHYMETKTAGLKPAFCVA